MDGGHALGGVDECALVGAVVDADEDGALVLLAVAAGREHIDVLEAAGAGRGGAGRGAVEERLHVDLELLLAGEVELCIL